MLKNKKQNKNINEFTDSEAVVNKRIRFKDIVNGEFFNHDRIVKYRVLFFFLFILGILYITNHYKVEKIIKYNAELNKEIKELRIEAITTSSELMHFSKQSVIIEKVNQAGIKLKELTEPPKTIVIEK